MKIPIGKILTIGTRVLGAILTGVPAVEAFAGVFGGGTGAQKKQAVLSLVETELQAAEAVIGHPLHQDADILAAAGAISDAVVAFHNLVATKVVATGAGV